jgi:hypothetical protein
MVDEMIEVVVWKSFQEFIRETDGGFVADFVIEADFGLKSRIRFIPQSCQ